MNTMLSIRSKLGEFWCRLVHEEIMWPVNGYYECRVCLRRYPVVWQEQAAAVSEEHGGMTVRWLASGVR